MDVRSGILFRKLEDRLKPVLECVDVCKRQGARNADQSDEQRTSGKHDERPGHDARRFVWLKVRVRDALRQYGPMDVGYSYADRVLAIYENYR